MFGKRRTVSLLQEKPYVAGEALALKVGAFPFKSLRQRGVRFAHGDFFRTGH